ncbi:hypothetical protein M4I32_11295 [Microbacterium sp. LRZ72]|uniref:hypothetical protein n=1 Tax=Microbacterium sp. LRZ72 TaxID=2942481 RepID=UPI0029B6E323|nr:hypothetical protein [Microbacterium sp. LRZ72]MDX2377384.1 hypothetical protein [Microbacterium sp. LRZ72]
MRPRIRGDRMSLAALALGIALSLSGCAAAASPAASPSGTAVAETADPASDPASDPEVAVVAFGDDCDNVFADPALYLPGAQASPRFPPSGVTTLGGISCGWNDSAGGGHVLSVYAFPEAAVPADLAQAYTDVTCEPSYDTIDCHLAGAAEGTWIIVTTSAIDERSEDPHLAPALAEALGNASSSPVPNAASRSAAWWDVDCAQLGSDADVAGLFDGAEFYEGYPTGFAPHPVSTFLEEEGVVAWCPWYSYERGGIWLNAYPGAGFQWDGVEASAASVAEVDGASAAAYIDQYGTSVLVASDGTNIVTVQEAPVPLEEMAARLLVALR